MHPLKVIGVVCFLVVFFGCYWVVDHYPSVVMALVCAGMVAYAVIELYGLMILNW